MRATFPFHPTRINQAQISFMYQRRRLQQVAGPLVVYEMLRQPAKLLVDKRHELIERRLISASPGEQQLCYFLWW
jgi:hypothetical protein